MRVDAVAQQLWEVVHEATWDAWPEALEKDGTKVQLILGSLVFVAIL